MNSTREEAKVSPNPISKLNSEQVVNRSTTLEQHDKALEEVKSKGVANAIIQ